MSTVADDSLGHDKLRARVEELKRLRAGWLDGEVGEPPDPTELDWVCELFFSLHDDEGMPLPHLYPDPEGGVRAEWSIEGWELSALIADRTASLDAVHVKSGVGKDEEVDLNAADGRQALVRFLGSFATSSE